MSAKTGFVGFRLNAKTDKDIIDDLSRFKNETERIKEMYRLAMGRGVVTASVAAAPPDVRKELPPEPRKPLENVPKPLLYTKNDLKRNMMQGF